ncbi:cytokine receptor-like factor 2 [Saimiri boliviensis]|uniref:cytokine receptor-like factor 2 n=1 Tax=Saimiri boliviensis TaxID=27679 RepID=UPI00193E181F|nr:cytokine receptor-like factor 2 [Saimiri boliviensis boliviensis]
MRTLLLLCGAAAVLEGGRVTSGQDATGERIQVQIIYFNLEVVQITWNASEYSGTSLTFCYRFHSDEAYHQCPKYIVHQGHTSGCLLHAQQKDDILSFSIRNGTHPVFSASRWIYEYLKPGSPKAVSFEWRRDAVTVTCPDLMYKYLVYEVQHQSRFDSKWQSKERDTCNVTIEGLDAENCYSLRVRVKASDAAYGSDTYPSDWSEVTHWQRGERTDSCSDTPKPPKAKPPQMSLISSVALLATLPLLVLSLWRLQRLKKCLMPSVPDPKSTFPGLFEKHEGNFQEWIRDTQHLAPLTSLAGGEPDAGLEEPLLLQLTSTEPDPRRTSGAQTGETEAPGTPPQVPQQPLRGAAVVALAGFTFVMKDSSYVAL